MTEFLTFILGFAVCAYLTGKLLARKAKNGERPIFDTDGSIYWKKDDGGAS